MAIDSSRSFEVDKNGVTVDSGTGIWIGGGDSVPVHSAPIGSFYLRTNGERYSQVGPEQTDWVIISDGFDINTILTGARGQVLSDDEGNVIVTNC
jgi:hypothetical protein